MAKSTNSFYDRVAPIILVLVVGLAFAVGVLWQKVSELSKPTTGTPTVNNNEPQAPQAPTSGKLTAEQAAKVAKLRANDHVRGGTKPEVYLIEYSDFQCPYCGQFHPTGLEAMKEYGDKFAWIYRHFPLDTIHPKARPAAIAAECITELGGKDAFWRFADLVFPQQETKLTDLSATAASLGINKANFDKCFNESRHEDIVNSDYQEGITAGVTGTPGNFIVNSKGEVWVLPGAVPYATLKATIEEALKS